MILLIDNYDSFVYNLARFFRELGSETVVVRNDRITIEEIVEMDLEAIVLSPGPGQPTDAGISVEVVKHCGSAIPVLGICLGHQAIAEAYGGRVIRAAEPVHGRTSLIRHEGTGLFEGIPDPFPATRYHSLIVDESSLPADMTVTAQLDDGVIMAIAHRRLSVFGVQFHPESILTENGRRLLANFLRLTGSRANPGAIADEFTPRVENDVDLPQPLHW